MNLDETFLARTDALASALRVNVEDLVDVLKVSRSSLFGWRRGRRKVSNRAWAKLEAAEREAGIVPERTGGSGAEPVAEDQVKALVKLMDEMQLGSAARKELLSGFTRSKIMQWHDDVADFWREAGAAGVVLGKSVRFLEGELQEEALYFSKAVKEREDKALQSLQHLSQIGLQLLGEEAEVENPRGKIYSFEPRPDLLISEEEQEFRLPFLGEVAAGTPLPSEGGDEVDVGKEFAPGHFVVRVNGASMNPDLEDGDLIVVDSRNAYTPGHGRICVVSDGSGSSVKRWNRKTGMLESLNPDYPDLEPTEDLMFQGYFVEKVEGSGKR